MHSLTPRQAIVVVPRCKDSLMTSWTDEDWRAHWVAAIRDELDEFKVPSVLRQQAALQATQGWPPKPGCCESPSYHGVPRLWADFPLAEWVAI